MKKIIIEHLARVEGNGGVTATLDGNVVTDVKFFINEGPRLIERLTLGKTPEEDVNLVPRICAICSLSHKYAAIRAMEKALNAKFAPEALEGITVPADDLNSDIHGSAEYRAHLITVMAKRAVAAAK